MRAKVKFRQNSSLWQVLVYAWCICGSFLKALCSVFRSETKSLSKKTIILAVELKEIFSQQIQLNFFLNIDGIDSFLVNLLRKSYHKIEIGYALV